MGTLLLSTPCLYSFIGGRSWLITDDEICYRGTCPPSTDVRIVDEDWYDQTTTADRFKCWQHCKFLRGGIPLQFDHIQLMCLFQNLALVVLSGPIIMRQIISIATHTIAILTATCLKSQKTFIAVVDIVEYAVK